MFLENTQIKGGGKSTNVGSYINTGIHPKPNGRVKIGMMFDDWTGHTPYQAVFGGYDSNTKNFGVVLWMNGDSHTTYFMDGNQQGQDIFNYTANTYYEFEYSAPNKTFTINGTDYDFDVSGLTSNSDLSIYLFTDNAVGSGMSAYDTTYTTMGKIYYFQYFEDDTLIADFIPVFKDGSAALWNKANNTLYTNAGTGSFVPGKIIESRYF